MYICTKPCFVASGFSYFCGFPFAAYLFNAVSVGLILWLAYHLATCVHSTLMCLCYTVCTVHKCAFVLCRLWLLFLLAVYRMSVQSNLIAYFHRCVQCTRYYCQCIYLFIFGNGLSVTVIYLTCRNFTAKALSRSDFILFYFILLLFF